MRFVTATLLCLLCASSAFALVSEGRPAIPYFNKPLYLITKNLEEGQVTWISLAFEDPDTPGAICGNRLDVFEGKELFADIPVDTWVLVDYELESILIEEGFTGDADVVRVTACKDRKDCDLIAETRSGDPAEIAYREANGKPRNTRKIDADDLARQLDTGRQLVKSARCRGCHQVEGFGADHAPSLSWKRSKYVPGWLEQYLRRPYRMRPGMEDIMMLKYTSTNARPNLKEPEVELLSDYLNQVAWTRLTPLDRYRLEPWKSYDCYGCHREIYREEPLEFEPTQLPAPMKQSLSELSSLRLCLSCHSLGDMDRPAGAGGDFAMAPDLLLSAEKLQSDYFVDYVRDPAYLQPGSRMPRLNLNDAQLEEVRSLVIRIKEAIDRGELVPKKSYYELEKKP